MRLACLDRLQEVRASLHFMRGNGLSGQFFQRSLGPCFSCRSLQSGERIFATLCDQAVIGVETSMETPLIIFPIVGSVA